MFLFWVLCWTQSLPIIKTNLYEGFLLLISHLIISSPEVRYTGGQVTCPRWQFKHVKSGISLKCQHFQRMFTLLMKNCLVSTSGISLLVKVKWLIASQPKYFKASVLQIITFLHLHTDLLPLKLLKYTPLSPPSSLQELNSKVLHVHKTVFCQLLPLPFAPPGTLTS